MWGNFSFSDKRNFSPKSNSKSGMNSTLPSFVTSPMASRKRQPDKLNQSMRTGLLSGAGPPLSSPFMPQIKRALGLDPDQKQSYRGVQRRHSFNVSSLPSSSGLPHVVLNKSRQLPLTERNSSMLKRSSTVKIAPPTPGKIASPSLYQMRNNSICHEDRSTPDTYAVVSALKERRKRSITSQEENSEIPAQHAKRRRQESQQSNASTSSMPPMPDSLPDLTHTDFSIRIETPNLKRPSRPNQDETQVAWELDNSINRPRLESRNNSILSSLSSSRRYTTIPRTKRSADFSILENRDISVKSLRRDPPKLSHFDSPITLSESQPRSPVMTNGGPTDPSIPLANGHIDTSTTAAQESTQKITQSEQPVGKPTTLKQLPSLKKKTSVFSALSQNSSFRKAQYANVVATLEDYDSDREAENRRVQQMLNDVDNSFTVTQPDKPAISQSLGIITPASSTSSLSVNLSTSTANSTSTATSGVSIVSVSNTILSSALSVPKSPIQEVGESQTKTLSSVINSNQTLSGLLTETTSSSVVSTAVLPSLVSQSSTGTGSTAAVTGTSLGGFKLGTSLTSSTGVSSTAPSTTSGFNLNGIPNQGIKLGVGLSKPITGILPTDKPSILGAPSSLSTTSVPSAPGLGTGFGFTSSSLGTSTAVSSSQPSSSTAGLGASTAGFGLGVSSGISVPTGESQTVKPGGFSFGVSTQTSVSNSGFGLSSTPAVQTGVSSAFSLGGQSSDPAKTSAGFSFSSTSSAPGGFTFNTSTTTSTAQPAGGFTFPTSTSSTPATGGFTFNTGLVTKPATTVNTGFSFGGQTSTSTPAFGSTSSTSTAPSTGFSGFSQPSSTQASVTGFGFTAGHTNPTTSVGGFSFGVATSTSGSTFTFGGSSTTTTTSTPFSFNAAAQSSASGSAPFSLNTAATTTTSSSLFSFGGGLTSVAASTPNTGFSFGQTPVSTASSTPAFQFGATNTSTTGFGFGTTNPPPAFGSANQMSTFGSANQTPAFGATSQAPTFGSTNQISAFGTTNQASAFGTTSQTPAFGLTSQTPAFGSTNQTPAFGATNQAPAFGSTNPAPTFGGSTTQSSVFGAPTFGGQSSGSSVFGAPASTQQTNVFGAPAINTNTSAFGTSSGGSPGFGKSHSMPSFGTNNSSSTGTFNFGGQPAPNVNPFGTGPTTPAKQVGSAFGTMNTASTPQNTGSSVFGFGQSGNDSVKKGFDFSASAGAVTPSTGGFNFAAAASSTPVFNFSSTASTPNTGFGTPTGTPSFSVGTGAAPRAPRPIAKGRRRGTRR